MPQVVQRQISSSSISGRPSAACQTILRMLKGRTLFQGQTTSHFNVALPALVAVLEGLTAGLVDLVDDLG
jgi:hypothetical protein